MNEANVVPSWPEGAYTGTINAPAWLRPFGLLWRGKVFAGSTVKNQIGPLLIIEGDVIGSSQDFVIRYNRWLIDTVHYIEPGVYDGHLVVFGITVRFTLRRVV